MAVERGEIIMISVFPKTTEKALCPVKENISTKDVPVDANKTNHRCRRVSL